MEAVLDALRVVNLAGAGLLAGGQMFCLVAVLPAMAGWPGEMSSAVHRDALTDRPHHFLRVVAATTLVSAIAVLVLLIVDGDNAQTITVMAIGVALTAVSSRISSQEWPINEEIKSWKDDPKLDRYAELRRLWDTRHLRRTWLSTAALVAFVIATVLSGSI